MGLWMERLWRSWFSFPESILQLKWQTLPPGICGEAEVPSGLKRLPFMRPWQGVAQSYWLKIFTSIQSSQTQVGSISLGMGWIVSANQRSQPTILCPQKILG